MAFLNNIKGMPVPPIKNVLKDAWQTAKETIPDRQRQQEYDDPTSEYGGSSQVSYGSSSVQHRPPHNVHFADSVGGGGGGFEQQQQPTELNPLNPFNMAGAGGGNNGVSATNPFSNLQQDGGDGSYQGYQETSFNYQDGGFPPRQDSIASDSTFAGGEGEMGPPGVKITEIQAAWNVTNAIQGMFIVSLPFSVLRGGYWGIIAMVGIAYICCYTGKILVQCLYEPDPATGVPVRVRDSYVSIAKVCFGKRIGARVVSIAQIIELLMTCILYVVVCGDLMAGVFPEGAMDSRSWMMFCGVFLIPLAFLKSIQAVSVLSFWCTMSHLFINFIILAYCLLEIGEWGWSKVRWTIDMESFPISLGVIVFSYTSQIFLPTLEGSMADPSKFNWMLDWSHIAAAAFKAVFGYVCFLTFQDDTQQVITNNLHSPSFKGLVNICLVIKAVLSYPLPYFAACELLERAFFRGKPKSIFPKIWELDGELKVWGLGWRVGVITFTILMACFIPHFSILMGFIGSFTGTMLSFIWPSYFHLKLKGHLLEQKDVAFNYFIIGLGFLFGFVGIYDSGNALVKAFDIDLPL